MKMMVKTVSSAAHLTRAVVVKSRLMIEQVESSTFSGRALRKNMQNAVVTERKLRRRNDVYVFLTVYEMQLVEKQPVRWSRYTWRMNLRSSARC